jgi:hypothetical protein
MGLHGSDLRTQSIPILVEGFEASCLTLQLHAHWCHYVCELFPAPYAVTLTHPECLLGRPHTGAYQHPMQFNTLHGALVWMALLNCAPQHARRTNFQPRNRSDATF